MSEKLRGVKLDMVVFDEMADVMKSTQEIMDRIDRQLEANIWNSFAWGMQTGRVPERYCTYCNAGKTGHKDYTETYSDGHPFFNNNLEYLEWLYERKASL